MADERAKQERQERLEQALRANLLRRKAQARGRRIGEKEPESDADSPQEGEKPRQAARAGAECVVPTRLSPYSGGAWRS